MVLLAGWRLDHAGGLPGEVTYAASSEEAVERAVALAGTRPEGAGHGLKL